VPFKADVTAPERCDSRLRLPLQQNCAAPGGREPQPRTGMTTTSVSPLNLNWLNSFEGDSGSRGARLI
jgi:hypothetical protein